MNEKYDKIGFGIFQKYFQQGDATNERFIGLSNSLSILLLRSDQYKSKIIINSKEGDIEFIAFSVETGAELNVFKVDMANPNAIAMIIEECSKYHDLNGPSGMEKWMLNPGWNRK